jgi:hypothetical protein
MLIFNLSIKVYLTVCLLAHKLCLALFALRCSKNWLQFKFQMDFSTCSTLFSFQGPISWFPAAHFGDFYILPNLRAIVNNYFFIFLLLSYPSDIIQLVSRMQKLIYHKISNQSSLLYQIFAEKIPDCEKCKK